MKELSSIKRGLAAALLSATGITGITAQEAGVMAASPAPQTVDYRATVIANASTDKAFAPYMIGSWNGGRVVSGSGILLDLSAEKKMRLDRRFNWGAGIEAMAGYGTAAPYDLWNEAAEAWTVRYQRQQPLVLRQIYAEVKYRGVYITAGMKDRPSWIVDGRYSSGDLVRSNNARPVPGLTAGFVDFQNIPFTNGWLQIEGEIMYGRLFDTKFTEKRFNYYTSLIAGDLMYTYKRCYFRTKPEKPLSAIFGMQAAGQFGGNTRFYKNGKLDKRADRGFHFRDLWDMFFPMDGNGEGYYKGNSLGSWDLQLRYRLPSDRGTLQAYFEWPWEDGSGIGRRNGWDGLWGLRYDFPREGAVSTIVAEYIDFTNHSGPIHWAPDDHPGNEITSEATGGDNYYNNDVYGPYAYYGMAIGSPFLVAPIYNEDGYWMFARNRARGFHLAVGGRLSATVDYTVKVGHQTAWGEGRIPSAKAYHSTSASVAASWVLPANSPLLHAQAAFDAGSLRGDNFGMLVAVSYTGDFNLKKTAK